MITLDEMASLARGLLDAQKAVADAEKALSKAKEHARVLTEETIPSAMQELGVKKLVLDTGQTLTLSQEVYASIPEDGREKAFDWLEENGFGSIIKTEVTAAYGKGGVEDAVKLTEELKERGLNVEFSRNVHAQTLKAFLREQLAKAKDVPLDVFGARPVWQGKVK